MLTSLRGSLVLASRLRCTNYARITSLKPPVALVPVFCARRYLVTESSSEGPQSQQKTDDAKKKVQSDPRLKEIDDLIEDKFAQIREEDYGNSRLLPSAAMSAREVSEPYL